ncbi:MAG TPA: hypothetical protein VHU85_12600 [Acidimicrobiales bacterium]|jgi:hypothetical protein|nr:hypothetical protein [Acidimicrobiales bacterium]
MLAIGGLLLCSSVGGFLTLGTGFSPAAGASATTGSGTVPTVGSPAPARPSTGVVPTATSTPVSHLLGLGIGLLPPANPVGNILSNPNLFSSGACSLIGTLLANCQNPCADGASGGLWPILVETLGCTNYTLQSVNNAAAQEGVSPMTLPSNFVSLSVPEQLFVVADLERVDRGLPPYLGLVPALSNAAQQAAVAVADPNVPAGFPVATDSGGYLMYGGAWAGGYQSVLGVDYAWMYDDGWGGSPAATSNIACTSANAPGCWGHRDELLGSDPGFNPGVGLACTDCVMGAGYASAATSPAAAGGLSSSYTDLVVEPAGGTPAMSYTWNDALAAGAGGNSAARTTSAANASGYWQVASDGGIFAFGNAGFYGSTGRLALNQPIVGMARTPDGRGYWLVASDGGIFSFGDAKFYGSTGALHLNQPIVRMAATPDGRGYWLVASDGGIFSFGDAGFHGSTGGFPLNRPIVDMTATPDGRGYWLVASDGGIFTFGDAGFHGSTGGVPLSHPIVGMAKNPDGGGYWLVASDGGVFAFGDSGKYGSASGLPLNRPIVSITSSPNGGGYWLVASDGGIFSFGNAGFFGSTGGFPLNRPIVGMAT